MDASIIYAIIISILSWIIFSTVNGYTAANNNCCKSNDCGTGIIDKGIWWINLLVALISTLYALGYIGYTAALAYTTKGKSLAT